MKATSAAASTAVARQARIRPASALDAGPQAPFAATVTPSEGTALVTAGAIVRSEFEIRMIDSSQKHGVSASAAQGRQEGS